MNSKLFLAGALLLLTVKLIQAQECGPDKFICDNGRCIPHQWVCDLYNDCGDSSDEPGNREDCPPCLGNDDWQCANGLCIHRLSACNGINDCQDNSDEPEDITQCPACREDEYTCGGTGQCIRKVIVCNGYNNCGNWDDETEENCPCAENQFRCPMIGNPEPPRGICIPASFVCDNLGICDCPDCFDESNCTSHTVHGSGSGPLLKYLNQ